MAKRIPGSSVSLCPKEPGANFRPSWTQGLRTGAVGIPATIVFLAHKHATAVCPPPLSDITYGDLSRNSAGDGNDLDTTAGFYSAGTQIGLASAGVILYVRKCIGRVLSNAQHYECIVTDVVLKVEAADGLSSVVYESVGRTGAFLRITIGED